MTGFVKHGFDLCSKLSFGTKKLYVIAKCSLYITGFVMTGLVDLCIKLLLATNKLVRYKKMFDITE